MDVVADVAEVAEVAVDEVLGVARGVIRAFPLFHTVSRIDDVLQRETVGRARTVCVIINSFLILFGEIFCQAINLLLIVRLRNFQEVSFEGIRNFCFGGNTIYNCM